MLKLMNNAKHKTNKGIQIACKIKIEKDNRSTEKCPAPSWNFDNFILSVKVLFISSQTNPAANNLR